MRLTPLQDTFAHEVLDLSLWKDLDETTLNGLRTAWRRHGVLVFRRQSLSEPELVRFFSHFGKSEIIVRTDWQYKNSNIY